jgi:hypothetical protein
MADDIIEQITPHIYEILRIVLVKGRSLRELNELVGKTSKDELYICRNVPHLGYNSSKLSFRER